MSINSQIENLIYKLFYSHHNLAWVISSFPKKCIQIKSKTVFLFFLFTFATNEQVTGSLWLSCIPFLVGAIKISINFDWMEILFICHDIAASGTSTGIHTSHYGNTRENLSERQLYKVITLMQLGLLHTNKFIQCRKYILS